MSTLYNVWSQTNHPESQPSHASERNRNGTIRAPGWIYPVANDLGGRRVNGRLTYPKWFYDLTRRFRGGRVSGSPLRWYKRKDLSQCQVFSITSSLRRRWDLNPRIRVLQDHPARRPDPSSQKRALRTRFLQQTLTLQRPGPLRVHKPSSQAREYQIADKVHISRYQRQRKRGNDQPGTRK